MMPDEKKRRPRGRLKGGSDVLSVNDAVQIQNIVCKTRTCGNQCWVSELRKSDNKVGRQIDAALKENNNA